MHATRADPVAARGVSKSFGRNVALDELEFAAGAGEVVALMGRNGSGKSTLLRILAGSVLPDRGEIDIRRDRLGWVLGDEHAWYWRLTGLQNLEVFGALRGMRLGDARRQGALLLEELRLADAIQQPVAQYSTGMKARLALARARLGDPAVVLLDEPTRGLDADAEEAFLSWLSQAPATVIVATHSVSEAVVADRVLVLRSGRVVHEFGGDFARDQLAAALHEDA